MLHNREKFKILVIIIFLSSKLGSNFNWCFWKSSTSISKHPISKPLLKYNSISEFPLLLFKRLKSKLEPILLANNSIEVCSYDRSPGIHFMTTFTYFWSILNLPFMIHSYFSEVTKCCFITKNYEILICIFILMEPFQFLLPCSEHLNSLSNLFVFSALILAY